MHPDQPVQSTVSKVHATGSGHPVQSAGFKVPPAGMPPPRTKAAPPRPPAQEAASHVVLVGLLEDIRARLSRLEVGMASLAAAVDNLQAGHTLIRYILKVCLCVRVTESKSAIHLF